MDAFIKAASGPLDFHISELLHEVFRGGPSVTLSLDEDQLWRMIHVIFAKGKETTSMATAALLDAFQELLQVRYSYQGSYNYLQAFLSGERFGPSSEA